MSPNNTLNEPGILVSLLPVVLLIAGLALNVIYFEGNSLGGPSQLVLVLCSAFAMGLGFKSGRSWSHLLKHVVSGIESIFPAILMLLLVGSLVSSWVVSGIVPAMIYYGLAVLDPAWFLVSACLVCAVVAVSSGSSWTTIATVGIALMGIGVSMAIPAPAVAGAVISGAYFGDKLSPLSDTTNLAAGMANVDVFVHIRYLLYTSVPSILIALVAFMFLGAVYSEQTSEVDTSAIASGLTNTFVISPALLLVPALVIALIIKRTPALPAIFAGILAGVLMACFTQREALLSFATPGEEGFGGYYSAVLSVLSQGVSFDTGNQGVDELLSSGGMAGMLNTVWLAITAVLFGGAMEGAGFLQRITAAILTQVRSSRGLIPATVGSSAFTNLTASDQYLAIALPGRMFARVYAEKGLAPENLSRSLEDGGTVTSVLVPWNACGVFVAGVLGVSTLEYAPFVIFCFVSPLASIVYALFDIRIRRVSPQH